MPEDRSHDDWHYVVTEGTPVEFRIADREHTISATLVVNVIDGKFVFHRLVDGELKSLA